MESVYKSDMCKTSKIKIKSIESDMKERIIFETIASLNNSVNRIKRHRKAKILHLYIIYTKLLLVLLFFQASRLRRQ